MHLINDNLAIGDRLDSSNLEQLEAHGITGVLNVAHGLDIVHPVGGTDTFPIEYHKVGLIDGAGNLATTLAAAVLTLAQLRVRHRRVLVHCHGGISRSSTVVALYIAASETTTFDAAVARVRKAHPNAYPNDELVKLTEQLKDDGDWISLVRDLPSVH